MTTTHHTFDQSSMRKLILLLIDILILVPVWAQATYHVTDYGAKGDGTTDDAPALQRAIDACSADGGGRVLLSRGKTFLSGPLQLKSGVELYLDAGATLLANPDENVYRKSAFGSNQGEGMLWLWAKDAHDIRVCGRGTIDGNGVRFMGHVLTLIGVKNVQVRDITIREGAYWTLHLVGCEDAVVDGINLLNNLKIRNGDGIDIDHSRHVRISNCHITSGDDCICLKNRREFAEYGSCHDIVVTNCTMSSRSCAIKIGSENMDSIYNVSIDNCIITRSNRGLGIQNRDEGTVTDVVFSNIIMDLRLWSDVWWGKAEPIYVTSYPRADGNNKDANWRFPKGETHGRCGEVSRIYFRSIVATSENGCFIGGEAGKVKDIHLDNVSLRLCHMTDYKGGIYDKRPCRGEGYIYNKVYGVYVDQAQDIHTTGLSVTAHGVDYGGPAFGL